MKAEIKAELKKIELLLIQNTDIAEIVKHFADIQEQFEQLQKDNEELNQKLRLREEQINSRGAENTKLSNLVTDLQGQVGKLEEVAKNNLLDAMRWSIEKTYAEKMIVTLKSIMSAALTKSAVEQKGFLDLSAYLPAIPGVGGSYGNSGNITGKGEVKAGTVEKSPVIE